MVMEVARKKKLDALPYDVFYQIISELDCFDYNHLARVNRRCYAILENDYLAKRSIESHLAHTEEARMAARKDITFREAIGRLYDTKEAVALANPYAVAIVSYATSFLYHRGVLCYIYANEIRVLNVHRADKVEQVLNVRKVLRRIIPTFRHDEGQRRVVQLSLLHYNAGVVAFLVEIGRDSDAWLIVLDVTPHGYKQPRGYKPGRVRFKTQLQSTRRLFVRHDGKYLFYGSYATIGTYDEPQWTVQRVDLTKENDALTTRTVFLENFAGSDVGQSACFEMFQDHLYAVSNVIDSDEEELNWTSYYEWVCIPPDERKDRPRVRRIWRREHLEGPINDTWTDMSLREDEATGQLMIFECRREWRKGGSENMRTYYTQPLPSPSEALSDVATGQLETRVIQPAHSTHSDAQPSETSSGIPIITGGAGPSNLILSGNRPTRRRTLNEMMTGNRSLSEERPNRYVHSEYREGDPSRRHDFILARTKFRTYNPSASAFLDLVNDPEPNPQGGLPQDRLRLRICSRKRKSPFDEDGYLVKRRLSQSGEAVRWSDERFESRGIKLWPSEDTPPAVADLLCPGKRTAGIHAVADERSIVYSVDVDDDEHRALVLIGFDPRIRLPSMQRLRGLAPDNTTGPVAGDDQRPVGIDLPRSSDVKVLLGKDNPGAEQPTSSVRTEQAMHIAIKRGYWLR